MKSKQEVLKILRDKILYLEMKPGNHIIDTDIAKELDVSRTPVRESLLTLQIEHLIDIYPQRGTFVSLLDLDFLREVAYVRHVVERDVLFSLAQKRVKPGVDIEKCLDLQEFTVKRQDVKEYVMNDLVFHQTLFKMAGHEDAWDIIKTQFCHVIRFQMLYLSISGTLFKKSLQEHKIILQCIANGDIEKLASTLKIHHDCVQSNAEVVYQTYREYFV